MQEMWNQVLQKVQAMEGTEQPTWLEQPPHGLFLVQSDHNSDMEKVCISDKKLWFCTVSVTAKKSLCDKALFAKLCFAKSSFIDDEILCEFQFEQIFL